MPPALGILRKAKGGFKTVSPEVRVHHGNTGQYGDLEAACHLSGFQASHSAPLFSAFNRILGKKKHTLGVQP